MTYVLEFDEKKDHDELFYIGDIACIMDKSHGIYLMGMEINWEGGLNARGFTFKNPNASSTCGCGNQFCRKITKASGCLCDKVFFSITEIPDRLF